MTGESPSMFTPQSSGLAFFDSPSPNSSDTPQPTLSINESPTPRHHVADAVGNERCTI